MNKKIQFLIVLVLVAGMFVMSTGSVAASSLVSHQEINPECDATDCNSQLPPPPSPPQDNPPNEEFGKEQPPGPRCEFTQPSGDTIPDEGDCVLDTNTVIDNGQPQGVSVISSIYQGDLPFPMNGMPLLSPPTGVEFFPTDLTGAISVCFLIPEGKSGNISFWDTSSVPNVETVLPTFVSNGYACAIATQTGVYGLVENLP